MKKLRDFLRKRKQYDSIKFALLLFVCAACFLVHGIVQTVSYGKFLGCPAEYILEACSDSASLEIAPSKICEVNGVINASFQRDYIITAENDKVLTVSELSDGYLSMCYGIEDVKNGKKIWLNSAAFEEFIGESENTSVRASYAVDGRMENAEFVICNELPSDSALAVSAGTTATLGQSQTVRVMFDSIDITGTDIRKIENLGYTVTNREAITARSYGQELFLAEIKCDVVASVLSFIGGCAFLRLYKTVCQNRCADFMTRGLDVGICKF